MLLSLHADYVMVHYVTPVAVVAPVLVLLAVFVTEGLDENTGETLLAVLVMIAAAPFLLVLVAAVFPVTGALVQIAIGLAAFFAGEALRRVTSRSWFIRMCPSTISRSASCDGWCWESASSGRPACASRS